MINVYDFTLRGCPSLSSATDTVRKKQNKDSVFITFFHFYIMHKHFAQEQYGLHSEKSVSVI